MQNPARTPQEYLTSLPEPRKTELKELHQFIKKTAPQLKPYMQSGMIGYGKYHYTYASGREGDWARIGLASQKNYISLYICATAGDKYLPEYYKDRLGKVNIGKSCIRFRKLTDLDLHTLKTLIEHAAKIT